MSSSLKGGRTGLTATQQRKQYKEMVGKPRFDAYSAYLKKLPAIQGNPTYSDRSDELLFHVIEILMTPALTGLPFFDGDIPSLVESERARFIAQVTPDRITLILRNMLEEYSNNKSDWNKRQLEKICKAFVQPEAGAEAKNIFLVPLSEEKRGELLALFPDEIRLSVGAVPVPVVPVVPRRPVFIGLDDSPVESTLESELKSLEENEKVLQLLFKLMLLIQLRATGLSGDDEGHHQRRCNAYNIDQTAVRVNDIIYGGVELTQRFDIQFKEFHRGLQHCRDGEFCCSDCGVLCAAMTICLKMQLREHCEEEKSIDRLITYAHSKFAVMGLAYYIRWIIGRNSVLATELEHEGRRSNPTGSILEILKSMGIQEESQKQKIDREQKQVEVRMSDMDSFRKHLDIEMHGMSAYHSVRDCGCDSRFDCPHAMFK
jgi:hypothetical protein